MGGERLGHNGVRDQFIEALSSYPSHLGFQNMNPPLGIGRDFGLFALYLKSIPLLLAKLFSQFQYVRVNIKNQPESGNVSFFFLYKTKKSARGAAQLAHLSTKSQTGSPTSGRSRAVQNPQKAAQSKTGLTGLISTINATVMSNKPIKNNN